ncbi:MAG: dCTP deaminase [Candidatus Saccharibacteria bacterium]
MLLSDVDIKQLIEKGEIKLDPMPDFEKAMGPVSLDFRLGHDFLIFTRTAHPYVDVKDPETFKNITNEVHKNTDEKFIIHPNEFILASTLENLELPDYIAGRLEGKSSLGRLGLVVHSTAGKFDPGWKGKLVLEITNIGVLPIALYPEIRVCQMLFEQISSKTVGYTERGSEVYKFQNKTQGTGGNWN